jgi:hypothetical protein
MKRKKEHLVLFGTSKTLCGRVTGTSSVRVHFGTIRNFMHFKQYNVLGHSFSCKRCITIAVNNLNDAEF